jgi:hypothetical protein
MTGEYLARVEARYAAVGLAAVGALLSAWVARRLAELQA